MLRDLLDKEHYLSDSPSFVRGARGYFSDFSETNSTNVTSTFRFLSAKV